MFSDDEERHVFAFKSKPPPFSSPIFPALPHPLHLAGFTCWQRLTHHYGNGFIGMNC